MPAFWLTFRIHADRTRKGTYEERYDALVNAVTQNASLGWTEPTSFLAFESAASIETLGKTFKGAIDPEKDLFLLRRMDVKQAVICGASTDRDIYTLMADGPNGSYLKKI